MRLWVLLAVGVLVGGAPAWADEATDKAWAQLEGNMPSQRQLLEKRSAKGELESTVQLAAMLEQGIGGPRDPARALDLYEKAAQRKKFEGLRKMCYAQLLGEGRPIDLSKGLSACYALPADDAGYLYGSAYDYDHGITGPKNDNGAVSLYIDAAKTGSGEAADTLGQKAMAMGRPDSARVWFRKGATLGSVDAMEHLAKVVETGASADPAEAAWLRGFAARGGAAPDVITCIDLK